MTLAVKVGDARFSDYPVAANERNGSRVGCSSQTQTQSSQKGNHVLYIVNGTHNSFEQQRHKAQEPEKHT